MESPAHMGSPAWARLGEATQNCCSREEVSGSWWGERRGNQKDWLSWAGLSSPLNVLVLPQ